jgi:nitronate monooxygenase
MLGVTTPEMVAAVCNEGGLGSLPIGGLAPDIAQQLIRKTKTLTDKPFAVNLFAHKIPVYKDEDLEPMRKLMMDLAHKRKFELAASDLTNFRFYTYHDQIGILVEEGISLISFTFGCLDSQTIHLLKDKGCILIGTATCMEEAVFLQQENIDMVVAQGIEAGGHRGTFLENISLPLVGLFSLIPQVKSAIQIPCIAAGGINSGETIKAAFELGADAVQIGTSFIGTKESQAIGSYKERLAEAKDTDTKLTRAFTGRWARGIRNQMMKDIEQANIPIPPYPLQNVLTAKLRRLAQQAGDSDYTTLWAGQSAGHETFSGSKEVLRHLIAESEALYR